MKIVSKLLILVAFFIVSLLLYPKEANAYPICDPDNPFSNCFNSPTCPATSCTSPDPGICARSDTCPSCGSTSSDCCAAADPWTKYKASCRQTDPVLGACSWLWIFDTTVCSTADKCINPGSDTTLSAGTCSCNTGGAYKTCCANTNTSACVQYSVQDNQPPPEGVCPANTTIVYCGGSGQPACGQDACNSLAPPPPPPPTTYGCSNGACVQSAGGPFTEPTCGRTCTTGCQGAPKSAPTTFTTVNGNCSPIGQTCPVSCTKSCPNGTTAFGTLNWFCGGTQWATDGTCNATCTSNPTPTPPPPPPPPGVCTYTQRQCPASCTYREGGCLEVDCDEINGRFRCFCIQRGKTGCYDQFLNYCGEPVTTNRFCPSSNNWYDACNYTWTEPNPAPLCGNSRWGCYCPGWALGFPIPFNCSQFDSPNACHSGTGDDSTCTAWSGPACGTQTRTCKTTSCQNCSGGTRQGTVFTISGNVWIDANQNGVKDSGESDYNAHAAISDGFTSTTTDGNGNYSFSNITCGNYVITLTLPANYDATTTNPVVVTSPTDNTAINFGIARNDNWSIAGNIFVDLNNNGLRDGSETNYSGSISISISPQRGTTTYSNPGQYLIQNLQRGNYTVSYTNPPAGYSVTYPVNGPPPSFSVGLGPCNPGGSNSAACNGQRLDNLNFGIAYNRPWIQCKGADCRIDGGFTSEVPSTAIGGAYANLNGSGGTPGLIFTGSATPNFGQGQASTTNWVVGGPTYGELYSPTRIGGIVKTSYNYIFAKASSGNITPTDLAPHCSGGLANCTLTFGVNSHGVYRANGDVTLNAFTFPAGQNFVILVNGNLTIRGKILVPNGSTALFSASGNINIDKTLGEAASSVVPTIEGIYSADRSFVVQGYGGCTVQADLRFNVAGSVIANAALAGGSFQNQRDLCANDAYYPTIYFAERLDFVLNTPEFMKQPNFTYQEIAP